MNISKDKAGCAPYAVSVKSFGRSCASGLAEPHRGRPLQGRSVPIIRIRITPAVHRAHQGDRGCVILMRLAAAVL